MVQLTTISKVLAHIEQEQGYVTPPAIVEYARLESSPIHDCFEWDDEKAAEEYRLWQARELIVRVKIIDRGIEIQKYHNVRVSVQEQAYYSWDKVKRDMSLVNEVMKIALDEIEYWCMKYGIYETLTKVVNKEELEKAKLLIKEGKI